MNDINIFFRKKPLKMICLGFSSGLPILLVFSTLSVWLVKAGVDRSTVTLFSWAGFAYAFKYLWSPLVDNYQLAFFISNIDCSNINNDRIHGPSA